MIILGLEIKEFEGWYPVPFNQPLATGDQWVWTGHGTGIAPGAAVRDPNNKAQPCISTGPLTHEGCGNWPRWLAYRPKPVRKAVSCPGFAKAVPLP